MATETRPDDVSDRPHDDAWPSTATEIGLLSLLGETVGGGLFSILLIDLVFSVAILAFTAVLHLWR